MTEKVGNHVSMVWNYTILSKLEEKKKNWLVKVSSLPSQPGEARHLLLSMDTAEETKETLQRKSLLHPCQHYFPTLPFI